MAANTDNIVKFLSTTVGRDRINRFLQYLCKFLLGYGAARFSKETLARITQLMNQATNTRKVMRLGRQLEFYKLAEKAAYSNPDDILRYTSVVIFKKFTTQIKNAGFGLWLVFDALGWAHSSKIIELPNPKDVSSRAFKFWLIGLIASFLNDLHRLRMNAIKIGMEEKALKAAKKQNLELDITASTKTLAALKVEKDSIIYTTIQDGLDICIPATALEYLSLDNTIIGFIGVVTSVMGGFTQWKSISK
jgi:peroxin-11B